MFTYLRSEWCNTYWLWFISTDAFLTDVRLEPHASDNTQQSNFLSFVCTGGGEKRREFRLFKNNNLELIIPCWDYSNEDWHESARYLDHELRCVGARLDVPCIDYQDWTMTCATIDNAGTYNSQKVLLNSQCHGKYCKILTSTYPMYMWYQRAMNVVNIVFLLYMECRWTFTIKKGTAASFAL